MNSDKSTIGREGEKKGRKKERQQGESGKRPKEDCHFLILFFLFHAYLGPQEGEVLEGDSKYSCEGCKKKVCALKRCTIKKLSPTLIIHLKRFEYNLERQSYHKLTNYFEFPAKINMEPYTKEGIDKKEKGVQGEHPPEYFVSVVCMCT